MKIKNNTKYIIIIGILLVVIFILPVVKYKSFLSSPAADKNKAVQVKIKKGMNSGTIIDTLYDNGLLTSKLMAKIYLKISGGGDSAGKDFKAGVYKFNYRMTPLEIFEMLKQHKIDLNYVKFTIPEGYNTRQIAEKMVKVGLINDVEELYRCFKFEKFNYKFLDKLPKNRLYAFEGYLFPDSYEFEKGMTVRYMVDEMLGRFNLVYSRLKPEFQKNKLSIDDIIIVASMVEEEAMIDADRAKIAAVIYNRLKINMRLQIDATVQYALDKHKSVLYLSDLKVDSPYNTYKYKGLPEGPISNPGVKSIEAALNPDKNNYIYYVAKHDGSGGHYFTDSYTEFLKAKKAAKK
jgi:UPF0755 protein